MIFSICALTFVLPASIAILDSFAGLTVVLYIAKKIIRISTGWRSKTSDLDLWGKARHIWVGFGPKENILNRPLQYFAAAIFISVIFSQYHTLSLLAFFGKFIKCVFLFLSFIEAFTDRKRIQIFLFVFLSSGLIVSLSGFYQHFSGRDFVKGNLVGVENFLESNRINATFYGANGFGAYLMMVLGLVINLLFTAIIDKRSWILTGALTLFLILSMTCLCWTYSRSSWVGFLMILFVMVILDRRKFLFTIILSLVFIYVFLPSLNHVRHLHLINDNSNQFVQKIDKTQGADRAWDMMILQDIDHFLEQGGSGRFAFWEKAVSIIRTSPIYGTGLNTYTRILKRNPDTTTWWYAHNCYLQLAAETGLLGLASFLWLLFVLFRHSFNKCHQINDPWQLAFLQGAVSGLFGFMVQSFFDNTFYTVQLGVLMWLFFGLTVALIRINNE